MDRRSLAFGRHGDRRQESFIGETFTAANDDRRDTRRYNAIRDAVIRRPLYRIRVRDAAHRRKRLDLVARLSVN